MTRKSKKNKPGKESTESATFKTEFVVVKSYQKPKKLSLRLSGMLRSMSHSCGYSSSRTSFSEPGPMLSVLGTNTVCWLPCTCRLAVWKPRALSYETFPPAAVSSPLFVRASGGAEVPSRTPPRRSQLLPRHRVPPKPKKPRKRKETWEAGLRGAGAAQPGPGTGRGAATGLGARGRAGAGGRAGGGW